MIVSKQNGEIKRQTYEYTDFLPLFCFVGLAERTKDWYNKNVMGYRGHAVTVSAKI
jgi:hypothetical protein